MASSPDIARPGPDEIGFAEEPGDETVGRAFIEVAARADLDDPAVPHDRDPVRHHECFFLVMRDVDCRPWPGDVHAADFELNVLAQLAVERAERLIHQQSIRLDDHGARERDTLLLSAGKLADGAAFEARELDLLERFGDPLFDLVVRAALHLEAVSDVSPAVICGNSA